MGRVSHLGLDLERIKAIDHFDLTGVTGRPVSESETAVWLSHQKTFKTFIQSDHDYCIVFEDDAVINLRRGESSAVSSLKKVLTWAQNEGIGLVQLGHISHLYRPRTRHGLGHLIAQWILGSRFIRLGNKTKVYLGQYRAGAHAYLISRQMATALAAANNPPLLTSDDFFSLLAQNSIGDKNRGMRFGTVVPSIFDQESRGLDLVIDSDVS